MTIFQLFRGNPGRSLSQTVSWQNADGQFNSESNNEYVRSRNPKNPLETAPNSTISSITRCAWLIGIANPIPAFWGEYDPPVAIAVLIPINSPIILNGIFYL